MSFQKNLKIAAFGTALLTLVSCGSDHSSKSSAQEQRQDELSQIDWKIFMQGRNFPEKGHAKIVIDGEQILSECLSKQKYEIDRTVDPQTVTLLNYMVPTNPELMVTVSDCKTGIPMIDGSVPYDIVKSGAASEVIVNL